MGLCLSKGSSPFRDLKQHQEGAYFLRVLLSLWFKRKPTGKPSILLVQTRQTHPSLSCSRKAPTSTPQLPFPSIPSVQQLGGAEWGPIRTCRCSGNEKWNDPSSSHPRFGFLHSGIPKGPTCRTIKPKGNQPGGSCSNSFCETSKRLGFR